MNAAKLPIFEVRMVYEVVRRSDRNEVVARLAAHGRGVCSAEAWAAADQLAGPAAQLRALGLDPADFWIEREAEDWFRLDEEGGRVDAHRIWNKRWPEYPRDLAARLLVPETLDEAFRMYGGESTREEPVRGATLGQAWTDDEERELVATVFAMLKEDQQAWAFEDVDVWQCPKEELQQLWRGASTKQGRAYIGAVYLKRSEAHLLAGAEF